MVVRGQGSRIFHLVFITYKFHIFESNFEAISFPIFYKDPEAVQKRKTKHAHTFCGGEREREKHSERTAIKNGFNIIRAIDTMHNVK